MFIPMNAIHPINPWFSISLTVHDYLKTITGFISWWINNLRNPARFFFIFIYVINLRTWTILTFMEFDDSCSHHDISIKHVFGTYGIWIESFYGGFNAVSAWTWIFHRISYETPLEGRLNAFLRYVWHNPLNHSIWTMVSYTMKCENIVNIP